VTSDVAQVVNLLAAAILTGNELGTWAVVHPAIQRLPFEQEVPAEREITRRYGYFMPGLMLLTVVSGYVAAGALGTDSDAFGLVMAGTVCFTVMLAITLAGNVPINVRTLRFEEAAGRDEWRALRRRWDRLHTVRIALDAAGLVLLVLAAAA
jgi:uncharacterized membrane protein